MEMKEKDWYFWAERFGTTAQARLDGFCEYGEHEPCSCCACCMQFEDHKWLCTCLKKGVE